MNEDIHKDENHIILERRHKLEQLEKIGVAFPNTFVPKDNAYELHNKYDNLSSEELLVQNVHVKLAGRIRLKRIMGKVSFVTLQDEAHKIQIYVTKEKISELKYEEFKHYDIGDIIGVSGKLFKTKTNELTINIETIELITKSIRPLPEKFHGLIDQELRYRKRYLDLIMNEKSYVTFITRFKIIKLLRDEFTKAGYLEVETPMMHPIVGGANAKPFITHHNTLDMQLYLRVAPELYLKRLIIGGFKKVFELNRNFRNEGLSTKHNPEFTMLEFYESYANCNTMIAVTENVLKSVVINLFNSLKFIYQDKEVDFNVFEKITITDAILKYNKQYSIDDLQNQSFLKQELQKFNNKDVNSASKEVMQLALFEETTENKIWNPTFIINYPVAISPLARPSDTNSEIAERFELFVIGSELANGYSELNDSNLQSQKFKEQVLQKENLNDEAMHYDSDYIEALEYGMPHTGGCGIGVDRLVMLLTNSLSIRDVILFPHMRQK